MDFWHLTGHFFVALLVSLFIWRKTKSKFLVVLCFLASFGIDIDHLFDFWKAYGFSLDIKKFFEIDFFKLNGGIFVPLHGWEWAILLFALAKFLKKFRWFLLTLSLVLFFHILWDSVSYQIQPLDYFFFWRAAHDFKMHCGW